MRVELLANPNSGRGAGPGRALRIAEKLRAAGCRCEIHVGSSAADSSAWAVQAASEADRLVVVGGDGTLNSVLHGIAEHRVEAPPLALAALGTANLLANEFKLPRRSEGVARLVLHGQPRLLDSASVRLQAPAHPGDSQAPTQAADSPPPASTETRRYCLLVTGFGLDGELMRRMELRRTGPIRKRQYFGLLRRILIEWNGPPQRVTADGEELGTFPFAILTGIRTYASRAFRLPAGEYDDGLWELLLFPKVSWSALLAMVAAASLRRLEKLPGVVLRHVREVRFHGEHPSPVQLDGDYAGATPLEFKVDGPRLPVLLPRR